MEPRLHSAWVCGKYSDDGHISHNFCNPIFEEFLRKSKSGTMRESAQKELNIIILCFRLICSVLDFLKEVPS